MYNYLHAMGFVNDIPRTVQDSAPRRVHETSSLCHCCSRCALPAARLWLCVPPTRCNRILLIIREGAQRNLEPLSQCSAYIHCRLKCIFSHILSCWECVGSTRRLSVTSLTASSITSHTSALVLTSFLVSIFKISLYK